MYFLDSPYAPLGFTIVILALATQVLKHGLREAGLRHNPIAEAVIPFVPIALGAVAGAFYARTIGLGVVTATEAIPWPVGAMHGAVLGALSGHLYKIVLEVIPEKYADILRQNMPQTDDVKTSGRIETVSRLHTVVPLAAVDFEKAEGVGPKRAETIRQRLKDADYQVISDVLAKEVGQTPIPDKLEPAIRTYLKSIVEDLPTSH